MGLMAYVPIGPVSAVCASVHSNGALEAIYGSANEVAERGWEVLEDLWEELMEVNEEIAEEREELDEGEEIDQGLIDKREDLQERIQQLYEGIGAGLDTASEQAENVLDVDEEEYSVEQAYLAFERAFYDEIDSSCPVRTGYLRSSCACAFLGDGIMCVALADYAQYVEYGTSKMRAQPYFEQAVQRGIDAMMPYLQQLEDQAYSNALSDGRSGADAVVSAARSPSQDLSSVIGGVASFIISMLVMALLNSLIDLIESMFDDIDYEVYIM